MGRPEVLMVAEKPSIASSIASVLSKGKHTSYGGKLPVHVFEGTFQDQTVLFKVIIKNFLFISVGDFCRGTCVQS